ncbi:YkvA family protein [Alkalidesulfovibrio alkalitolerans]|uniref:YkvA family protein n=1 Tax=Alkalidesulfovibrio alkalitolerans TaxID=293256 RepID=UPI0009FD9ADE|nr:YkvA family protein [Alkalidesulfovibrio alkalitolerans]
MLDHLKSWAKTMKRDVLALYLAGRDPRVPWYVKLLAAATAAYALSPIDLIPDFIPVIGYLDDIIILPTAIWLTVRLIPQEILAELRNEASLRLAQRPRSVLAAGVIVTIWLGIALMTGWLLWRR